MKSKSIIFVITALTLIIISTLASCCEKEEDIDPLFAKLKCPWQSSIRLYKGTVLTYTEKSEEKELTVSKPIVCKVLGGKYITSLDCDDKNRMYIYKATVTKYDCIYDTRFSTEHK